MEEDLDSLARLLEGDFAWRLAGGMAISASLGRFYRRHTDIDIEVEGSNLGRLVEKARAEGYGLFSRGAVARLGTTTMMFHFVPLTEAEALTGRWGAIRLARVRDDGSILPRVRLHDWIDVHVYWIKDGVSVFHNGMRAPATLLNGVEVVTKSGRTIRAVDVRQVLAFKKCYFSVMDRYDKRVINRYLLEQRALVSAAEEIHNA